ncbi:MAG TPA: class I SAM-dependent methyltransferase [Micromonosporaceae bacterium]
MIEHERPGDAPPVGPDRTFARRLAAQSLAEGDDTGWFEKYYAAAEQGTVVVHWVDSTPNQRVVAALAGQRGPGNAIVTGCGSGEDAEHVASLGYATVAFDVSPTAIAVARRRHPHSAVQYVTANLLSPPRRWQGAFDLVIEAFTLQVLSGRARRTAIAQTAALVAQGGRLLVVATARDEHEDAGTMPWPLTRAEIESFVDEGLLIDSIVEDIDHEAVGAVRRWRAWFSAPDPSRRPQSMR